MSEESMEKQLAEEAEAFLKRLHEKYSMEQQNKIINHIYAATLATRREAMASHEAQRLVIAQSSEELVKVIANTQA